MSVCLHSPPPPHPHLPFPLSHLFSPLPSLPSPIRPRTSLAFYMKAVDQALTEAVADASREGVELEDLRINLLVRTQTSSMHSPHLTSSPDPSRPQLVSFLVIFLPSPLSPLFSLRLILSGAGSLAHGSANGVPLRSDVEYVLLSHSAHHTILLL